MKCELSGIEPFSLRLRSPLSTAHGPIEARRGFVIAVVHDGDRGIGEASPLPGWTEPYADCRATLERFRSPSIDRTNSIDPSRTESIDPSPADPVESVDPTETPAAAHAIESARFDCRGRREGRRLADLLRERSPWGGRPPETVPVNATIGATSIEAATAAASAAVESGYGCLKLKAGVGTVEADLDRIEAVRETVTDDVAIRVDANAAWDRPTAARAIDRLATAGVEYLEQPLDPDDLDGHASLRERGVPIALDESLRSNPLDAILAAEAADLLVCKPMVLGGPGRTIDLAADARDGGIEPVVTTTIDAAPARITASHVAAAIPNVRPCGLATGTFLAEDLIDDPPTVTTGTLRVPDEPGIDGDRFDRLVDAG